ncbi:unnamed protein product [Urochloa humidicola]
MNKNTWILIVPLQAKFNPNPIMIAATDQWEDCTYKPNIAEGHRTSPATYGYLEPTGDRKKITEDEGIQKAVSGDAQVVTQEPIKRKGKTDIGVSALYDLREMGNEEHPRWDQFKQMAVEDIDDVECTKLLEHGNG